MKNTKSAIIKSSSLILISLIIGLLLKTTFDNVFNYISSINVTGSAKTDFTSDIIVWECIFRSENMILDEAYNKLEKDKKNIITFLKDNEVPLEDAIFTSIKISEEYENKTDRDGIRFREFTGYILTQNLKIESKAVNEIERISRDVTTLINKGISIQSREPYYFYSKLADLKIDMISQATKDAKLRAEMIAESSKSILGKLLTAKMGVFQIIAKNSTENYSWGGRHNKTSKHKTATVTMKLEYAIEG